MERSPSRACCRWSSITAAKIKGQQDTLKTTLQCRSVSTTFPFNSKKRRLSRSMEAMLICKKALFMSEMIPIFLFLNSNRHAGRSSMRLGPLSRHWFNDGEFFSRSHVKYWPDRRGAALFKNRPVRQIMTYAAQLILRYPLDYSFSYPFLENIIIIIFIIVIL